MAKVSTQINVIRTAPSKGGKSFLACVGIGKKRVLDGGTKYTVSGVNQCARGKNPRKALAAALRKAASEVGKRKGAFAGRK